MAYHLVSLLNNYMREDREPEAGEYKHNDAEHFIWIFDRRTRSVICFGFQCGPKRHLTPQLLCFSFVLDRIVHLPVPSGNVSGRGKKISKISRRLQHNRADGATREAPR
jgi:hypothetical protein